MKFTDVIIPILVLVTVVIPFLKLKEGAEKASIIIVGILIMGFSIYISVDTNDTINGISNNTNTLLAQRKSDSINNSTFQQYLKDTFGIERKGNTAIKIINNTTNNYQASKKDEALSDSINYFFKLRNDTLAISPKEGTWVHAYIAFDTVNGKSFEGLLHEGMGTSNWADKINVNGKIYLTHLFKMYDRAVYNTSPIELNMAGHLNRYIIFGDEGIPRKRYIYKHGKVNWIPEK